MTAFRIEKLARGHTVEGFDRGRAALNRCLVRFALANQGADAAQPYIALADDVVIGCSSLAVGEVAYGDAPERLTKWGARTMKGARLRGAPATWPHGPAAILQL